MLKSSGVIRDTSHAHCKHGGGGCVTEYAGCYVQQLRGRGLIGINSTTAPSISHLSYSITDGDIVDDKVVENCLAATAIGASVAQETVLTVGKKLIADKLVEAHGTWTHDRKV